MTIAVEIRSGQLGDPVAIRDYRAELLGDVLVERIIWDQLAAPRQLSDAVVADTGYLWFRFWLPRYDQVVERYYTAAGDLVGTQIDVCMPLICDEAGCHTADLVLDIWIAPEGRVTVHNEEAFERAVLLGQLTPEQAQLAERHLRDLTAAIARNRFPPPLVRNWQVDPSRIATSHA